MSLQLVTEEPSLKFPVTAPAARTSLELEATISLSVIRRGTDGPTQQVGLHVIRSMEDLDKKLPGGEKTVRQEILDIYFATMNGVYNEDPANPVMLKTARDRAVAGCPSSVTTSAEEALNRTYELFLNGKGFISIAVNDQNMPIGITCGGKIETDKARAMFRDADTAEVVLDRLDDATKARPIYLMYFAGILPSQQGLMVNDVSSNASNLPAKEIAGRSLYELFWRLRVNDSEPGDLMLTRTINPAVAKKAGDLGFSNIGKLTFVIPSRKTVEVFCKVNE